VNRIPVQRKVIEVEDMTDLRTFAWRLKAPLAIPAGVLLAPAVGLFPLSCLHVANAGP
jgi:hypothetical protein